MMNGQVVTQVKKLAEQRASLIQALALERERLGQQSEEIGRLLAELQGPAAPGSEKAPAPTPALVVQPGTPAAKVVAYVARHPGISGNKISVGTGISILKLRPLLKTLVDGVYLVREGNRRTTRYRKA